MENKCKVWPIRELVRQEWESLTTKFPMYIHTWEKPIEVSDSRHLKRCHGIFKFKMYRGGETFDYKIVLSIPYFEQFGEDNMRKTFRHEVAHFVSTERFKSLHHSETWADLCQSFGGMMNSEHAARFQMAACEMKDGLQTPFRWKYTCPSCGRELKTKTNKRLAWSTRRCKCGEPCSNFIQERL